MSTTSWLLLSQSEPHVTGVEGIIHRSKRRERRVLEESAIDKLTGLQNQDQWVMARHRADQDATLWVLRADVDRFKEINDSHGHAAGDSHLQLVARAISRGSKMVGISPRHQFRSGGDEFTIIGTYTNLQLLAKHLRHVINSILGDGPGSVSIGIGNTDSAADAEMYNEKKRCIRRRSYEDHTHNR